MRGISQWFVQQKCIVFTFIWLLLSEIIMDQNKETQCLEVCMVNMKMSFRESFLPAAHSTLCKHLELQSGHPDHHGVPGDAEHHGQRVEDDGDVVHDGVDVHRCRLLTLGSLEDGRVILKHRVAGKQRNKKNKPSPRIVRKRTRMTWKPENRSNFWLFVCKVLSFAPLNRLVFPSRDIWAQANKQMQRSWIIPRR